MKAIVDLIRREPVMIVTLVLAILNVFFNLSEGQTDAVRNIIESVIVLLGGTIARANVTPVAAPNLPTSSKQ